MTGPGPTLDDIYQAQSRIQPIIHRTPLITSQSLDGVVGGTVRLKMESLQRTGSFKVRGAYNRVAIAHEAGASGVVTASSGNHGQAVAWAARAFGLPAVVVVPSTAPPAKRAAAEAFGARLESVGPLSEERLQRARAIAQERDYTYIPPYDDRSVMAGQGTIGLEILDQWPEVEVIVVPIGGGGLISGIASAVKSLRPNIIVIGVEPAGAAKAYLSRQAGRRLMLPHTQSLADGLISLALGELTYPVIEALVDHLVTVTEDQIRDAFWFLWTRMKMVAEPSGVVTLAYALSAPALLQNRHTALIVSGGNLDPHWVPRLYRADP